MSETVARRTQADRRATTREALLRAATHGLSTFGYANLALEQVARDAGYTRGALYHQFANKEELVLAVVEWIGQTWDAEVRRPALDEEQPLAALTTMAREHARYCRTSDGASVMLRRRIRSPSARVGRRLNRALTARNTSRISSVANAAPMQRRVPPPNGIGFPRRLAR